MYRVMIVDDEALERQGLHLILEKQFGDKIDITDASNGKKAIEMAYMTKLDIVFMDMKMPGIDGIEAIKAIQGISPATKFVVVSAYDSFNYAQKAISMNVCDYLLKPVKRKDIIGCMDRLLQSKEMEIEKIHGELELRQQVEELKPYFQQEFVQSIIDNNSEKTESISKMQLLEQNWNSSYCMVIDLEFNKLSNEKDTQEKDIKKRRLEENIIQYLNEEYQAVTSKISEKRMVTVIPITNENFIVSDTGSGKLAGEYLLNSISEKSEVFIEIKIGVGNPVSRLEDLNRSYNESIKGITNPNCRNEICHFKDFDIKDLVLSVYPIEEEKNLCVKVQQGLKSDAKTFFDTIFSWIDENVGTVEEKRIKFLELTAVIDRSIPERVKDIQWRKESQLFMEINITQSDIIRLKDKLWSEISDVIDEINLLRDKNMDSIINKAKDYIYKNYTFEISLEEISQYVSVSPYYFSKLFKQQTGENFIDFLTFVRIEKAKEILRTTDFTMKVVASKVGYKDPNYFSRVFKKVTNMKPSDFRQK